MDETGLKKWFSIEMGKVHQATVRQLRPLHQLLDEDEPTAPTAHGEHLFDPDELRALADELPLLVRERLKLPIQFRRAHETPGSCFLTDQVAIEAVEVLGLKPNRPDASGPGRKAWVGEPLARDLARRFPTCFQFLQQ